MRFPADLALRRQLWRQWVHLDAPQGDRGSHVRVTRTPTVVRPESTTNVENWARSTIEATPGVVDGLRSAIAAAVVEGQLSNADRARFIGRATRLGLSRFEANLLVAAVQHREAEKSGYRIIRRWKRPKQTRSVASIVGTCVALEAVAAAAVMLWLRA